ncbi:hypothetical protein CPG37_13135 [Malaciobacter canalis]|jgi:uncharacterized membrane protein|uniref:Membrane protein n=2 Tax=Malaciobacter TaxID=2321114 RepID=A0AB36ZU88_9BACT|nr:MULTISPECIES: hypothetical protein [Malaciobacter]PHO08694.1 hypothetical protein CPG37_13135 [Malaciobacter canalis]PPK60337.1 putative membrane protein [Malaciobacter marinus]QEE31860.1 putative membrane protein [Malaciobacter canalis]SKB63824.1 Uncharacterized membrane protein [Malaciobacter marinus]
MFTLFENNLAFLIFLHVLSAVIWVGGMIAIRFAIHYSMQGIQEPKIRLERTLENLKRFFNMVIPTILILLITAIIMILILGFKGTNLYSVVIAKEIIWTVMSIVFITIYVKRNKAQKLFEEGDFTGCKKQLLPIAKYFIPLNIFLGLIAIYLGVTLRGF